MTDTLTGTTQWARFLATGYDRRINYALRSRAVYRQLVDYHPSDVTNPGTTVTLTIANEYASLATTPLTDGTDVDAVAPPAPDQVNITINEYGNASIATLKLRTLAFAQVDPAMANLLGKNQIDTIDKLVQTVADGASHVIGLNGGTIKSSDSTSPFAANSVTSTDKMTADLIGAAVAKLEGRNAQGRDAEGLFVGTIHPFVARDVMKDSGWLSPHQYVDTQAIYNNEIGTYLGVRWLSTSRATKTANTQATPVDVYNTHIFGAQALVEAVAIEPHVVIGPQTDKLRRNFPIGWYGLLGEKIYRDDAIQLIQTASGMAGL